MQSSMHVHCKPAPVHCQNLAVSLQLPLLMVQPVGHAHARVLQPPAAIQGSKQAHSTQKTKQPSGNTEHAIDKVLNKFHKKMQATANTSKQAASTPQGNSQEGRQQPAVKAINSSSSSKDRKPHVRGQGSKASGPAVGSVPSSSQKPINKPSKTSARKPLAAQGLADEGLDNLTGQELDQLFDEVFAEVSQAWDSSRIESSQEEEVDNDAAEEEQSSTGKSLTFKGFGAPPRDQQVATAASQQPPLHSQPVAAASAPNKSSRGAVSLSKKVPPLRVFLYAADAKQTLEAITAAGWESQVVISEDLHSAHAVVGAKQGRTGKHHKLQQGERTARNSKVPFVCVGRRMSRDNLVLALAPILQAHRAQHGVVDEDTLQQAIKAAGVPVQRLKQQPVVRVRDLPADWRERRIASMGLDKIASLGHGSEAVDTQPQSPHVADRELALV